MRAGADKRLREAKPRRDGCERQRKEKNQRYRDEDGLIDNGHGHGCQPNTHSYYNGKAKQGLQTWQDPRSAIYREWSNSLD